MKSGYVYTLIFALVLSAVFGAMLAGANAWLRPAIEENELVAEKRSVLDAFGLPATGSDQEVGERFDNLVQAEEIAGLHGYVWQENGQPAGYALPFAGAGLWGTIRGYLAVSADFSTVLGLTFIEQNETPGLGGRIDEPGFKEQFREFRLDGQAGFAYGAAGGGQLDAITGATQTSNAVLQILNRLLQQSLANGEGGS